MLTASVIAPDGTAYVSMARRMVTDWRAELPRDYPLGYPFLIRLVYGCGGFLFSRETVLAWQRSGQFVALISGTAVIALIYLIGRRMIGARVGLLAAWIWALLPSACALSADALSDMPTLCLVLGSLLTLMKGAEGKQLRLLICTGLLSGAAYCIRPEGAEAAIVGIVFVVAMGRVNWSQRIASAVAVGVGFLFIGGSYAALEGGRLINKQTWLQEETSAGHELIGVQYAGLATLSEANLIRPVGAVMEKIGISMRYLWLVPALIYPFLGAARRDRRWCTGPPAYLFLFHLAVLIWFQHRSGYLSHRHTMLLAVFLVILAAGTLSEAGGWVQRRMGRGGLDWFAIAIGSLALSPWLFRDINSSRWYIHDAAAFVSRANLGHAPNIVAQHGWVPFYSGLLNWAGCPHAANLSNCNDLVTADFAVFDTREAVPGLVRLRLGGPDIGLTEAARFIDPRSSRGVVIYRVIHGGEAFRK